MGLRKCPRCELNYIHDDQKLCDVCSRKHNLSDDEDQEVIMCSECGEHRAMKGRDLCSYCYKESLRQEQLMKQHKPVSDHTSDDDISNVAIDMSDIGVGSVGVSDIEVEDMEDVDIPGIDDIEVEVDLDTEIPFEDEAMARELASSMEPDFDSSDEEQTADDADEYDREAGDFDLDAEFDASFGLNGLNDEVEDEKIIDSFDSVPGAVATDSMEDGMDVSVGAAAEMGSVVAHPTAGKTAGKTSDKKSEKKGVKKDDNRDTKKDFKRETKSEIEIDAKKDSKIDIKSGVRIDDSTDANVNKEVKIDSKKKAEGVTKVMPASGTKITAESGSAKADAKPAKKTRKTTEKSSETMNGGAVNSAFVGGVQEAMVAASVEVGEMGVDLTKNMLDEKPAKVRSTSKSISKRGSNSKPKSAKSANSGVVPINASGTASEAETLNTAETVEPGLMSGVNVDVVKDDSTSQKKTRSNA